MYSLRKLRIVILLLLVASPCFGSIGVKLTVTESAGVARTLEPVRFGIPIAESENLTATTDLRIKDSAGTVCPAQFRVLERWDSAPGGEGKIKVVLCSFQATVSASSTAYYYFSDEGGAAGTAPDLDITTNDGSTITVDTGDAVWTIEKADFAPITSCSYGGTTILSDNADDGIEEIDGATTYLSKNDAAPDVFEVEESGEMEIVVHVEGYNEDSSNNHGLRYICRIHFYAGKPYARVSYHYIHDRNDQDCTLNADNCTGDVDRDIDSLEINFDLAVGGDTPSYAIGNAAGETPWTGTISSGTKSCSHLTNATTYTGSDASGSGTLAGWINLYDANGGMAIMPQHFANRWPHTLTANQDGTLTYNILPSGSGEGAGGAYNFYVYQGFREDFVIYIHGSSRNADEIQGLSEGFVQNPLFPTPSTTYLCATRVFGTLKPGTSSTYTTLETSLSSAWTRYTSNCAQYSTGRWNYGAAIGPTSYSYPSAMNYYDTAYCDAQQWVRSGDTKWFLNGLNFSRFYTSTDMFYTGVGAKDFNLFNGFTTGIGGSSIPDYVHRRASSQWYFLHWSYGLAHYYRLTGDEYLKDRIVALADTFLNRTSGYWGHSSREGGNLFNCLMAGYFFTRDSDYLTMMTSHADHLLSYQSVDGVFLSDLDTNTIHWQFILQIPILRDLYEITGDTDYRDAIYAYADAMQTDGNGGCMVLPDGTSQNYDYDYSIVGCADHPNATTANGGLSDNSSRTSPRINIVNAIAYDLSGRTVARYYDEANRQYLNNFEDYGSETSWMGKASSNVFNEAFDTIGILEGVPSLPEDEYAGGSSPSTPTISGCVQSGTSW